MSTPVTPSAPSTTTTSSAPETASKTTPVSEKSAAAPKRKGLPDINDFDDTPVSESKKPEPKAEPKAKEAAAAKAEGKKEAAEEKKPEPKKDEPAEKKSAEKKEDKKEADEPAKAKEEPKKPEPAAKKKIKVDGKEMELTDEELVRRAQLYTAADERFKKAAETEKKVESLLEALTNNPREVLKHFGHNVEELAESILTEKIQKEMMDPVQQELEELRTFKKTQEEQAKAAEEKAKKDAADRELADRRAKVSKEFSDKIAQTLTDRKMPKTPMAVKRVAEKIAQAAQRKYNLDVDMAVDLVRDEYQGDLRAFVGELDGEGLIGFFGDELVNKIRKHDLTQLRAKLKKDDPAETIAEKIQQEAQQPTKKAPSSKGAGKLGWEDWQDKIKEKAGLK